MSAAREARARRLWRVRGRVQGVGFRPFVYRLARDLGLSGAVWNDPDGVVVDAEGRSADLRALDRALRLGGPAAARVDAVEMRALDPGGPAGFAILPSVERRAQHVCVAPERRARHVRVAPDLATCADCLVELREPEDRRFGYAFTNCTACGPRYSIARGVPWDRARTTMSAFRQCEPCAAEYADPGSRRFHAQPNACPKCGPRLVLEPGFPGERPEDAVAQAVAALGAGRIVALKGLGGFQLACDARSESAVARLRERKRRPRKPFAVMFPDLAALEREACVDDLSREALFSPAAPIVLVPCRPGGALAPGLHPGLRELGALLPYTPLHHQILAAFGAPLVMTSGNRGDEPIAADDDEARERLAGIADHLLLHDRPIHARLDDSIARAVDGELRLLRRARGYVPEALELGFEAPPLLAVGADLKNTLCLVSGSTAVLSQHVGDLEHHEARRFFAETRAHLESLLQVRPELVAHDLHPDYHGSALARASGLPRVAVQHHHAHVAACLVENGRTGPALGVAWDGSGYGPDGTIWGGEILVADLAGFERRARLLPVPLPGAGAAVREPWRMAVAHLVASGLPTARVAEPRVPALLAALRRGVQAPPTSSVGRLFDAVAALLGVCAVAGYEGQAAAELEALAVPELAPYPLPLARAGALLELDPRPLVRALVRDLDRGAPRGEIAGRFHAALAAAIALACATLRDETGLETVALSGGCFANRLLLVSASRALEREGFEVLRHARVPPGDGGLSLGQAAVAAWRSTRVSCDSR